ncbi:C4-dicarboxylate transport sensor protein DctB [Candidatus Rhodobacter oscarellae]|uniref:C4-dicarboxylate transport sensor protein DctB n=1 Tax=Candidatus Rhodobacter oscarellae TaxID=1675527 RepID=A0A0J9E456_9RHOB|nr:ATP-binding protein [Candidatus Rhodobacter lobularis]KMW57507.1 C4-dicarboxylate transport sensor protein DctB [Candidatus Rhodobacter lobularis]
MSWRARVTLIVFIAIAVYVIWVTNTLLTERFTANTKSRAEVRQALYIGNLRSELQRTDTLPLLLSRDPVLIGALNSDDYSQSSQHLIALQEDIETAGIMMTDAGGRTVAATDRNLLGTTHRTAPYYISALRSNDTVFNIFRREGGTIAFNYSRRIQFGGELAGVIIVDIDLRRFEQSWSSFTDAILVTDSEGVVILATEPNWRGLTEEDALAAQSPNTAIQRAIQATADLVALPSEALFLGGSVLRIDEKVNFQGWRMVSFIGHGSVRERVNGILALEIMGFAILLSLGFYFSSRRALAQSIFFQRESAELRQLNVELQREIAERQRVEKNLQVAEQTLAQSSKLAVLGEMSASVSHELNQPLAAMKTYLAGAKLLLQRRRPEEALSSFQRIDDLIERMGAITRQLKSFARKDGDAFEPIDARDCVSSAISMMEPQLKNRKVRITRTLPADPVMVTADRIRLDQVLINLLRNAIDATKDIAEPEVNVILASGEIVAITVRDNGPGIEDLKSLFEPFYTTKAPGDGVGLGLAISSGIVNDLGGRLTARNGRDGGAVFEIQLPPIGETIRAAE